MVSQMEYYQQASISKFHQWNHFESYLQCCFYGENYPLYKVLASLPPFPRGSSHYVAHYVPEPTLTRWTP